MKMCTRCGSLDLSVKKVVPSGLTFKLRSLFGPYLADIPVRCRPKMIPSTLGRYTCFIQNSASNLRFARPTEIQAFVLVSKQKDICEVRAECQKLS